MTDFAEGWSTLAGALLLGVKLAVSKSASELLDLSLRDRSRVARRSRSRRGPPSTRLGKGNYSLEATYLGVGSLPPSVSLDNEGDSQNFAREQSC